MDSRINCFNNKELELIIFPTEDCNFRCTYCYEDFSIGKMSSDTVENLKLLIKSRFPKLRIFRLSWFGGEPLLAKNIISSIYVFIENLIEETGNKPFITSHFTTNLSLIELPFLERVCSFGPTSLQVSLDGYKEVHDLTRKKFNGGSTFDIVWGNLLMIKDTSLNFSCSLRIHVTPENKDSTIILAREISKSFGSDNRFFPYAMKVGNWGGPNSKDISALSESEYQSYAKLIVQQLRNFQDAEETTLPKLDDYICYASKPNSFVIRADGRVGKCTVHLSNEKNDVGFLDNKGSLNLNSDKMKLWLRGFNEDSSINLTCPASNLLNNKRLDERLDVKVIEA